MRRDLFLRSRGELGRTIGHSARHGELRARIKFSITSSWLLVRLSGLKIFMTGFSAPSCKNTVFETLQYFGTSFYSVLICSGLQLYLLVS